MKRIATICARGGSKGVKNKNIRELNGKPLIHYTIEQVIESDLFDCICISSDSDNILNEAKKFENIKTVKRPDELSSDTAAKMPVVLHCTQSMENDLGIVFDTIVDIDCTSPLRTVQDIKDCVQLLEINKVSNVLTAAPSSRSPYFNLIEKDKSGRIVLSKKLETTIVRRQDAPECYDMNASIYVWNRETLFELKSYFLEDTLLHVMPEARSQDIDNELDFKIVEFILSNKLNEESE